MRRVRLVGVGLAWLASCYSPTVQQGAPCSPETDLCPPPQTCQLTGATYTCTSIAEDAPRPHDAVVDSRLQDAPRGDAPKDGPPIAIAYVQSTASKPTEANPSLALPMPVQAHDAIIVCLNVPTATINPMLNGVTDSGGNAYTVVVGPVIGSQSLHYIAIATNTAATNTDVVSISLSTAPGNGADLFLLEYSGLALGSAFDVQSSMSGNGTAMTSGSAMTSVAHELVLGYADAPNGSAGTGFTSRITKSGNLVEDEITFVATSYQATATTATGAWTMLMATFEGQ